jgi:hypothetical protein
LDRFAGQMNITQSQIDILFGALIGLVPTIIITLINLFFQIKREDKARGWQIEDQGRTEYLNRLNLRVKEAENVLKGFYEAGQTYHNNERIILDAVAARKTVSNEESTDEDYVEISMPKTDQLANLANLASVCAAIGDQELEVNSRKFISLISLESSKSLELAQKYANGQKINVKKEDKRINKFLVACGQTHGFLLHKLDEVIKEKIKTYK